MVQRKISLSLTHKIPLKMEKSLTNGKVSFTLFLEVLDMVVLLTGRGFILALADMHLVALALMMHLAVILLEISYSTKHHSYQVYIAELSGLCSAHIEYWVFELMAMDIYMAGTSNYPDISPNKDKHSNLISLGKEIAFLKNNV